ncbi:Aspartate racemase [uncultured Alphaproteobacteria bacterium]|uniref:Aspartate racemase n=1 Tax=uncultured Alphaproteobacteria bacterium TaxID=91750 RepID=A0A212KKR4_9PROT|nr:Aspartate racemase [uncultured Alphaproteobacteria bacterium]
MLGVLGGMGPLATVDFLAKLVAADVAETDQLHMPFVVRSVPQIPDRSRAIMKGGESPLPALRQGMRALAAMGATVAAIPCNTAHHWAEALTGPDLPPILHIVDAVADQLARILPDGGPIAVLATAGTRAARVYETRLDGARWPVQEIPEADLAAVGRGITLVKAGRLDAARTLFAEAAAAQRARGAAAIVLACTEIPTAFPPGDDVVDATQALAERCVRWYRESYAGFPPADAGAIRAAS